MAESMLEYAKRKIAEIQNGSGCAIDDFPEIQKGTVAKAMWFDTKFRFGMEYGYLLAMIELMEAVNEQTNLQKS